MSTHWDDDLLNRKEVAQYLKRLVDYRYKTYHSAEGNDSLCIAVDSTWGGGKSFFVDRWSIDVKNEQHPVVRFNAWENDLADDPLLGFIAILHAELKPLMDELPPAARLAASERLREVRSQAKKALYTLGIGIARGVVKKVTGATVDELVGDSDGVDATTVFESANIEKALDKALEVALKRHTDRRTAVLLFRQKLQSLIDFLVQSTTFRAPMYVFVDELDRCRPDYAIRLLEGIKHLFNVKDVCFVISTNLTQLSESVRAVYGQGFNGSGYLKRFISLEFALPTPSYFAYAKKLVDQSGLSGTRIEMMSGLPDQFDEMPDQNDLLAYAFSVVCQIFRIDLRSQKQVFQLVENVLAVWPKDTQCVFFYLAALAAVFQRSRQEFELLLRSSGQPAATGFSQVCKDIDTSIVLVYSRHGGRSEISPLGVLDTFHSTAIVTTDSLRRDVSQSRLDQADYPRTHLNFLVGSSWRVERNEYPSFGRTGLLVRNAGAMTRTT